MTTELGKMYPRHRGQFQVSKVTHTCVTVVREWHSEYEKKKVNSSVTFSEVTTWANSTFNEF